jgi:uncharacterized protein YjdB
LLTSFRVDNTDIAGNEGGNATVKASYFTPADADDKSLTVSVDDDTVATVTDNKDNTYTVNFLKAGTTKIHWVANDGGGAKVDANVTVTAPAE